MFLKVKKQRKCKHSLFFEVQQTVSHSRVFGWKIGIWCVSVRVGELKKRKTRGGLLGRDTLGQSGNNLILLAQRPIIFSFPLFM